MNYHQKALSIQLKVSEESHPDLAATYEGIGITLKNMGKDEEALKHFQKAFLILEKLYHKDHPQLVVLQTHIAQCKIK